MTSLLYLEDSYVKTFSATVVGKQEGIIFLDRTAFYPGGGGQPADSGLLSTEKTSWIVSKVKRVQGRIGHFIDDGGPDIGAAVNGEIDWERRYKLMRTHTAMHILCGVILCIFCAV